MSNEVDKKLAQIRATVESARAMPMSSSCVLSRSELLDDLDELGALMRSAVAEAAEISAHRDQFVSTGQSEAQTIMANARSEREELILESAVFREAQRRAAEMVRTATQDSQGLRRETDDYVDERLGTFEFTLRKTLEAVTRGRETLHRRSDLSDLGRDHDEASPFSGPPPS